MGSHYEGDMGAHQPHNMGTHQPENTGTHYPDNMGFSYQGDTDFHHQSNLDFHYPRHISTQHITDTDIFMGSFLCPRPIKTVRGQSSGAYQVHDGSQTAIPFRTVYEDSNVQEQIPVPDSARRSRTRRSGNSRKEGSRPEK